MFDSIFVKYHLLSNVEPIARVACVRTCDKPFLSSVPKLHIFGKSINTQKIVRHVVLIGESQQSRLVLEQILQTLEQCLGIFRRRHGWPAHGLATVTGDRLRATAPPSPSLSEQPRVGSICIPTKTPRMTGHSNSVLWLT